MPQKRDNNYKGLLIIDTDQVGTPSGGSLHVSQFLGLDGDLKN